MEAKVIKENNGVYLVKQDEQGKIYKTLIEKDYELYRLLTKEKVTTQVSPSIIQIYVSSKCNIDCPICYEDKDGIEEPSLEEIESLLKNFRKKTIALSGREPTCREDLFQIIRIANKRNHAILLTNGIKLSDYEYVLKLKKSGLQTIFFSFNGLKDEIYQRMNGKPLLDLKLKALENIKKLNIKTVISVTMARGINEDQIRRLYDFCLDNRSFVVELRFRSVSPVGRHLGIEPYCMSELLDLVASALEIKREDILKEHIFWEELPNLLKFIILYGARKHFRTRPCSFYFQIKKEKKFFSLGREIDIEKIKKSRFKILLSVYYLIKIYGIRSNLERFNYFPRLPNILRNKNILRVVLRCWPNVYNLDLEENKKCVDLYYKNGKLYPFCYYNIIESKRCL